MCVCRSKREAEWEFVYVCQRETQGPVFFILCLPSCVWTLWEHVCESVCLSPIQVWFSTVQPGLNGCPVCASFLTPTAALHPLLRGKCCTLCAKITGAFMQWLNPSSAPSSSTPPGGVTSPVRLGLLQHRNQKHRLVRQSVVFQIGWGKCYGIKSYLIKVLFLHSFHLTAERNL